MSGTNTTTTEPIDDSSTTIFTVTANTGGSRQGTPEFQSGDTLVAISTDDVNFTPVPTDGSTASVSGTYLTFTEDASGDLGTTVSASTTDQAVVDAINDDDGSSTPLSDPLYYELQDSQGNITYDQYTFDLGDVDFSYPNTGAYTPNTGETVTPGSTTDIGGATVNKALSSDGTYGGTSADSYVLTASLGTFDFARQGPDGTIAIDPTVTGGGGTVSTSSDGGAVTVTGTLAEINADFSTAQFTATLHGKDYIDISDTDAPVPTGNQIIGSLNIAQPVDSSSTTIFTVTANAGGSGQGTPGFQSGDTLVAISTDDVNFTPVPTDGSTASVSGTYLTFTEDASGDLGTTVSASTTNQAVVDAINDNDGSSTPLSDSLYYELQDGQGNVTYDQYTFDLGDVDFSYPDTGAYTPNTGETVTQGSTTDIGGPTVNKALSSDGTYGGVAADSYTLTATLGTYDFANQGPDGTITIDPTVAGGGGTVSTSSDGGTVTVTGTLGEINADFSTAQFTATQAGTDYIVITDTDSPVPTGNQIIGSLTIEPATPCYCRGTRILTARGEIPVEALRLGDLAVTFLGQGAALKPIRWLGHRTIDLRRHTRPGEVYPVRIRAGALAEGRPCRDLLVSPGHRFPQGGVLVAASELVNGASIVVERPDQVEYWHVELEGHDILLAEGVEAESYLDTGNRAAFENGTVVMLHPPSDTTLDGDGASPCVPYGEASVALRARLIAQAKALGWQLVRDPAPFLEIAGRRIEPVRDGNRYRFEWPEPATQARLCSRANRPADSDAGSTDHRRLGLALHRLALQAREVALDDPRLDAGFSYAERSADGGTCWRWTDGSALLPLAELAGEAVTAVEITIQQGLWFWVRPGTRQTLPERRALAG